MAGSGRTVSSERALNRLRRDLQPTLCALDRAAADLEALDDLGDELPALQYALHVAAEQALVPDVETFDHRYAELEEALSVAREETADVAEALGDGGPTAAAPLLWEWRVALFGVRLALQRLEGATSAETPPPSELRALPLVLLGAGVTLVVSGALSEIWPLWILGLAFVGACATLSHCA